MKCSADRRFYLLMWLSTVDQYHVILLSTSGPISFKVLSKHYLSDAVYVSGWTARNLSCKCWIVNYSSEEIRFLNWKRNMVLTLTPCSVQMTKHPPHFQQLLNENKGDIILDEGWWRSTVVEVIKKKKLPPHPQWKSH